MLKRVVTVFFLLMTIAGCLSAADVALVTDLQGSASARIEEDTWPVTLAEILPDGVEIRVAENSSMVIVHMLNNQEYELPAGTLANIASSGISGENVVGKNLQMVSSKIKLGDDSAHQAGSASTDRGVSSPAEVVNRKSMRLDFQMKDSFDDNGLDLKKEREIEPEDIPENVSQADDESVMPATGNEVAVTGDASFNKNIPAAPKPAVTAQASASVDDAGDKQILFAVPAEKYAEICGAGGNVVDIAGVGSYSEVEKGESWILLGAEINDSVLEKLIEIQGSQGKYAMKILNETGTAPTIVAAWKLEKAGFVHQAAAMWLAIGKTRSLSAEKVAAHLKRLRKQMTE